MTGVALVTLGRALGDAEHGVHEEGGNNAGAWIRKYLHEAGIEVPAAWCAASITAWSNWAANLLGVLNPLDEVVQEGLVQSFYNWGQQRGLIVPLAAARPGDLVCYRFPGGTANAWNHLGILAAKLDGGRIRTVEGNTSPGVGATKAEREREGDGVYVRERNPAAQPTAFIRWGE